MNFFGDSEDRDGGVAVSAEDVDEALVDFCDYGRGAVFFVDEFAVVATFEVFAGFAVFEGFFGEFLDALTLGFRDAFAVALDEVVSDWDFARHFKCFLRQGSRGAQTCTECPYNEPLHKLNDDSRPARTSRMVAL